MEPMPLKNEIKHLFPNLGLNLIKTPLNNKTLSNSVRSKYIAQPFFQKSHDKYSKWTNPMLLFSKINKLKLLTKIL